MTVSPSAVDKLPPSRQPFYKSTLHWKSIYDQGFASASIEKAQKASPAEWTRDKPAYVSHRGQFTTENEAMFGKFGESPNSKLPPPESSSLINMITEGM